MIDDATLTILREFIPGDGPGKDDVSFEDALLYADRVAMAAEIATLRGYLRAERERADEYEGGMRLMMRGAMGLLERIA